VKFREITKTLKFPTFSQADYFKFHNNFSFSVFVVLELELRAYTLSHSASPFCNGFFSR
jgi:hypothetical protein